MKSKKPNPPPSGLIIVPGVLKRQESIVEYKRVIKELGDKFDAVDLNLIIDYCRSHGRCFELQEKVDEYGEITQGPNGAIYAHPYLAMLNKEREHLAMLRRDLFFTPKSRGTKIQAKGKAKGILERMREREVANAEE